MELSVVMKLDVCIFHVLQINVASVRMSQSVVVNLWWCCVGFVLVYLIFESDGVSKGQKGGKDLDCRWN